jgi:UTP--glucose-1-phosphate uridylyltransferase
MGGVEVLPSEAVDEGFGGRRTHGPRGTQRPGFFKRRRTADFRFLFPHSTLEFGGKLGRRYGHIPMAQKITQALITAAGPRQRRIPLQTLTDRGGDMKPAVVIMIDEMRAAGIERVGVVVNPGDRAAYEAVLEPFGEMLTLIEQADPRGYGHAVLAGRDFCAGLPFLLQVSDHLYVTHREESCTRQLLELAAEEGCPVSAVQPTHERFLRFYGTVAGTLAAGRPGVYQVDHVIEKPSPTLAEQTCVVPGLRSGHYLCFFGMHVLTPVVFDLLEVDARVEGAFGLTPALARLAQRGKYLAVELDGRRADLEAHFGLLRAQIALALRGSGREELLALLAEELALDASKR